MTTAWTYMAPEILPPSYGSGDVHPIAYQSDHSGYAISELISQYNKEDSIPRMRDFLYSAVELIQPLEDLCWQLIQNRTLYDEDDFTIAVGDQLDGIGAIIGEPRREMDDSEYVEFLKARVKSNKSDGNIDDLWAILNEITLGDVLLYEVFPATIEWYVCETAYPRYTNALLVDAKPAGVGQNFFYTEWPEEQLFGFSATYGAEETAEWLVDFFGFGSTYNVNAGGYLTGVMVS